MLNIPEQDKNKDAKEQNKDTIEQAQQFYGYYQRLNGVFGVPNIKQGLNRFTGISLGQTVSNPHKATITEMPTDAKARAELVKTSSVLQKKGIDAAIKRMRENSPNFELLPELSTPEYVVVRNRLTNKIELAFRGTDPSARITSGIGKGIPEPLMWLNILYNGSEGQIFDQHNLEAILERLQRGGIDPNDIGHVSGYSMGGTKAHRLGDILGVDTTLLNPLMGKNFFDKPNHPNIKHNVYRTTEDIATAQGIVRNQLPSNVTVESIDPIAVLKKPITGLRVHADAISLHDLNHFVEEGNRTSDIREANDTINERLKQFERETQGVTTEQRKVLQNEMLLELQPELDVIGDHSKRFKARTGIMRGVISGGRVVGSVGAGAAAGVATEEILKEMGVENPYIVAGVSGASAGLAGEKILQGLGGATSLMNLRAAVLSGGAGAVTQEATRRLLNDALLDAGVDRDTAAIVSEGAGGAVGTSTMFAVPTAINAATRFAAQNAGRMALSSVPEIATPLLASSAVEAEAAVGLAEVGTEIGLETMAEIATEVGVEVAAEAAVGATLETGLMAAARAATIPVPGARVVGAMIVAGTLIAAGIAAWQHHSSPHLDYVLRPTRNQEVDDIVRNDHDIQRMVRDFNDHANYSAEKVENLESAITERIFFHLGDKIDPNYGYTARLIPAPQNYARRHGVIYEYDYSQIPEEVRTMDAYEYRTAVGDARLYKDHPMEYYHLTDAQKEHIIDEIMEKHPEIVESMVRDENQTVNYRLATALEADVEGETRSERDAIITPIIQEHVRQEQQQEALEEGIERFTVTEKHHEIFNEFLQTSPDVARFVENGDIDGLNRFLAESIYNPNISQNIFDQLTSTYQDTNMISEIMSQNLPQFNAQGEITYISAGQPPLTITPEERKALTYQATTQRTMAQSTGVRQQLSQTHAGRRLLEDSGVSELIKQGARPSEINRSVDRYYQTHPEFARKYNSGLLEIPKFTEDGNVRYETNDVTDYDVEQHRNRRQQQHNINVEQDESVAVESQ